VAQQAGVLYDSVRRVLKKHLNLRPYKITSVRELKDWDNVKSLEYC
jgi:hypothetical protein